MKTSLTFIFINLFCIATAFSQVSLSDNFTLRAGLSSNLNLIHTDRLIDNHESDSDGPEEETKTLGFGIVTSIGYRLENWEFALASDVLFGKIKDITFISEGNSVRGGGHFRLVSIGPQIKYYTPYSIFNVANFYLAFGPSWSLQTFVFSNPQTSGNFNNKRRISFENYGGGLFLGLEEIKPFKEAHPIFLEIGYSYMHSYKVSILDSTTSTEVITLSEGNSNDFSGQYVIIRAGVSLF